MNKQNKKHLKKSNVEHKCFIVSNKGTGPSVYAYEFTNQVLRNVLQWRNEKSLELIKTKLHINLHTDEINDFYTRSIIPVLMASHDKDNIFAGAMLSIAAVPKYYNRCMESNVPIAFRVVYDIAKGETEITAVAA